jgi:hypothetical protein
MKREKLVSVRDRVAELVEEYGSYRKAAEVVGVRWTILHYLRTNDHANPTVKMLQRIGLKASAFERA